MKERRESYGRKERYGYAALCLALGRYSEAKVYVDEMIKLQNCTNGTGGVLYATATYAMLPWEFHVWESVASSAWLYLVINNPGVLFPQVLTHGTYFSLIKPEEDTTQSKSKELKVTRVSVITADALFFI